MMFPLTLSLPEKNAKIIFTEGNTSYDTRATRGRSAHLFGHPIYQRPIERNQHQQQ